MKKFFGIALLIIGGVVAASCTGSDGPQGPPGPPGPPGSGNGNGNGNGIIAVYEKFDVNFVQNKEVPNQSNEYRIEHPIDLGLGDAVFVYFLDGVDKDAPIWTPLPREYNDIVLNINGKEEKSSIKYFYNFGPFNVDLFARGNHDLVNYDKVGQISFTKGLVFRLVYIQADDPKEIKSANNVVPSKRVSYDELVKKYNFKEEDVIKL
ncbi:MULTISPECIES: hypothetical protein [Myroides]|uniref:hypothetical protein n=1 Tax=Myroides TaxID=76831 RepID=UPI001320E8A3|nr:MULTISPECIES: hypothetical protein [Myroides]MVX34520.1 hypothetical protein [Myroides sp. LoEW2-1]UVD79499.1 hypothetical protein NWE55_15455 [Myroides albus]